MTASSTATIATQRRIRRSLQPLHDRRADLVILAPDLAQSIEVTINGSFACDSGRRAAALLFAHTLSLADRAACVQVLSQLKVKSLVLVGTGAVFNESAGLPDLLSVRDHINYSGWNPMIGSEAWYQGPRFLDMGDVYSKSVRAKVLPCLQPHSECVYAACPNVTAIPVEILTEAHLAGPWIVAEAITARYLDIEVLAFVLPRGADCCSDTRALESVPTADERAMVSNVIKEAL